MLAVCSVLAACLSAAPAPPMARPHPVITEVLYHVPNKGKGVPGQAVGDADRSGGRDATGDEFIEIINPHRASIDLAGYTLIDSGTPDKNQVRFVFPSVALGPGERAVVFNGRQSRPPGPVGTREAATGPNPVFDGAYVFSMMNSSTRIGFANKGDWLALLAPDGNRLQVVYWGAPTTPAPAAPLRHEAPKTGTGSVVWLDGGFRAHAQAAGLPYSPGRH